LLALMTMEKAILRVLSPDRPITTNFAGAK
jgi:hypothetical protein